MNTQRRQLYRARQPRTREGLERQVARLAAGGAARVAAAQAKRDRRAARHRAIAGGRVEGEHG